MTHKAKGYTLVELAIVVMILGILAAIVIPQCRDMLDKAKDATTKGNLGTIRASIALYYTNNDGRYPSFPPPLDYPTGYGPLLTDALVPLYLPSMPVAMPSGGHHRPSNAVGLFWNFTGNADDEANGYGHGWEYDANPDDIAVYPVVGWGSVRVMCKHSDSKGVAWSMY